MDEPADNRPLMDFIARQLAGGVKGFVIGEDHASVNLPKMLTEQMAAFKKAGVETLFIEHVPGDKQHMLADALAGKREAQRALYTYMIGNWHTDEAATARYNMIFAARDAGIAVVGIDTSSTSEHLMRESSTAINSMRFTMGDAYMAREILREHKDKPFFVLAGANHVGMGDHKGAGFSALGSIDTRLNAAGVKSVALLADQAFSHAPDFTVLDPDQVESVYTLSVPDAPEGDNEYSNYYARAGVGLGYLRQNFQHLVKNSGTVVAMSDVRAVQRRLDAAHEAFNACADVNKIASLYALVKTFTTNALQGDETHAGKYLQGVIDYMGQMLETPKVSEDRPGMCKPEVDAKWLRPAAKPQGTTHN